MPIEHFHHLILIICRNKQFLISLHHINMFQNHLPNTILGKYITGGFMMLLCDIHLKWLVVYWGFDFGLELL